MKKKNDKLLGARLVIWELLLGLWIILIVTMIITEQPLDVAVFWFAVGALILWRFIALCRRYWHPEARAKRKEMQEKARHPVSVALIGTDKYGRIATLFVRYANGKTGTERLSVRSKRFKELAEFFVGKEVR